MHIHSYLILLLFPALLNAMNPSDSKTISEKMILMEKRLQITRALADDRYETNNYYMGYSKPYMCNEAHEEEISNEQGNYIAQYSNNTFAYNEYYNTRQTAYHAPIGVEHEAYHNYDGGMYYQQPVNEQQYNIINYSNNVIVTYAQPVVYQQLNSGYECDEHLSSRDQNTDNTVEYLQDESMTELPEDKSSYGIYTNNVVVNNWVNSLRGRWICEECRQARGTTRQQIILHMALAHEKCYQCKIMQKFKSREEIRKHSFKHHPGTSVTAQTGRDKRYPDRGYIRHKDRHIIADDAHGLV